MSNRGLPGTQGSNTIGQYKVKPDGDLELVEFTSALCTFPRLFVFDESDQILIVACQFSNNIVAFTRNSDTGKLSRLAEYDAVTAPAGALIV
jgi:6-phosphogluconolactonase